MTEQPSRAGANEARADEPALEDDPDVVASAQGDTTVGGFSPPDDEPDPDTPLFQEPQGPNP